MEEPFQGRGYPATHEFRAEPVAQAIDDMEFADNVPGMRIGDW